MRVCSRGFSCGKSADIKNATILTQNRWAQYEKTSMKQESTIDYEQILLKDPLFTEYPLHNVNEMDLLNLLYFLGDNSTYNHLNIIDSYCPICKKDTTFNSEQSDKQELSDLLGDAGMYSGFPGEKEKSL